MTICFVAELARVHRRLWDASCGMDDESDEFNQTVEDMSVCRERASHRTPTCEEGWAFTAYIMAWCDGAGDRHIFRRVSEMIKNRHHNWRRPGCRLASAPARPRHAGDAQVKESSAAPLGAPLAFGKNFGERYDKRKILVQFQWRVTFSASGSCLSLARK
jgi:hypothetical protein